MLWTNHQARVAVSALLNTFIWPWDWWLGIAVCVLGGSLALLAFSVWAVATLRARARARPGLSRAR